MFASYGSGGSSPVWVTVLAARLIAGFLGGFAGSHASDAFFVAGASFVSIAFAILGIAVTTWMVSSSSHKRERWRGQPQPVDPSWGAMAGDDAPVGAPGDDATPRP